jgi:PAS domain-containing protein
VFIKSRDGRYLGVNRAWEAFFCFSRHAFIGKEVHIYLDAPDGDIDRGRGHRRR